MKSRQSCFFFVIPAKAGIQWRRYAARAEQGLDPSFRWDDDNLSRLAPG
jgi:hypothetical protein